MHRLATGRVPRLRRAEGGQAMTPAETPTEVCVECQRLTVTGHGTFPYAGGHTLALYERIRELEGLVRELLESGEWFRSMAEDGSPIDELTKRAEAALARSEGGT